METLSDKNYIPQIAIDCVIFGYENKELKVLVAKLIHKGDFYTIPSGYIGQAEDMDAAAQRILQSRTGLKDIYLEQFRVFGKANRNIKPFLDKLIELNFDKEYLESLQMRDYDWFAKRTISIGYYALVDINKVEPQLTDVDESIGWYNIHELPPMILDYNDITVQALKTLQSHIDEKLNAFNLLPEKFTMSEIQDIYETIFEKPFLRTNFQKKILEFNVLERLDKKYTGAKNKAPYLYRMKNGSTQNH